MRMLIAVEFADAGPKSGAHRILTIGRRLEEMESGNIGLSLEEAKSLVSAVPDEFVAAQAKDRGVISKSSLAPEKLMGKYGCLRARIRRCRHCLVALPHS